MFAVSSKRLMLRGIKVVWGLGPWVLGEGKWSVTRQPPYDQSTPPMRTRKLQGVLQNPGIPKAVNPFVFPLRHRQNKRNKVNKKRETELLQLDGLVASMHKVLSALPPPAFSFYKHPAARAP